MMPDCKIVCDGPNLGCGDYGRSNMALPELGRWRVIAQNILAPSVKSDFTLASNVWAWNCSFLTAPTIRTERAPRIADGAWSYHPVKPRCP